MSTIGIVFIALIAGAFLILLLLGLGLLLWKSFTLAQQMREAENQRAIVQVETAKTLDRYQTEIKALTEAHANRLKSDLESTKAAMNAIRAEIRSTWVEQTQALNALLWSTARKWARRSTRSMRRLCRRRRSERSQP